MIQKNLKKYEDAYIHLRTKHHYVEKDLHEHKEQNSYLQNSVQSISKVHKDTIKRLEQVQKKHDTDKKKWKQDIKTMGGILKNTQNEKELIVTEKQALESSIRRDSILHKKILDDLKSSKVKNEKDDDTSKSNSVVEAGPLSYGDIAISTDGDKFSLSTSAITKALEDVDQGLLTFVSEEEAAEEELRRIHRLLGVDTTNVNSPFRTY